MSAMTVLSSSTTRSVDRVAACCAWTWDSVCGRSDATRLMSTRSATRSDNSPSADRNALAAAFIDPSVARSSLGCPVTCNASIVDPLARKVASSTTKGPYAGESLGSDPSLYAAL